MVRAVNNKNYSCYSKSIFFCNMATGPSSRESSKDCISLVGSFSQQDYVIPTGKIQKFNINSTRKMAAKHAAKLFSLVTVVPCGRGGDSGGFSTAPSVPQLMLPQGDVLDDCGRIQMILANRQKKEVGKGGCSFGKAYAVFCFQVLIISVQKQVGDQGCGKG